MKTNSELLKWLGECQVWADPYNLVWHWKDGTLWYVASKQPAFGSVDNTESGFVDVVHTHSNEGYPLMYFDPHAAIPVYKAPAALQKKLSAVRRVTKSVRMQRLTEVYYLSHCTISPRLAFSLGALAFTLSKGLTIGEIDDCRMQAAERHEEEMGGDTLGLLGAVLREDFPACDSYVDEHYYDVDANFSLLQIATINGSRAIVDILIAGAAEVDYADNKGRTALHFAACCTIHDPVALVATLIGAGADVDALDDEESTPLLIAAGHGNADVARLLIDAGADIEAVTRHGDTPLSLAVEQDAPEFVALMISAGADINVLNRFGMSLLAHAKKNGFTKVAQMLTGAGALDVI